MSIRRINSTGRKKVNREDTKVSVKPDPDGVLIFDASISLHDYKLPEDARVFVEAYRQTTFMRFDHGTVATPQTPAGLSRRLTEFPTKEGLQFRVKVTSMGERPGLLLAEGDRIPFKDDEEQPDKRIPLLPIMPDELGHETWRIDFSGANGPLLLVNNQVDDWKALAASPLFRSMVYPAAMRQVLWHIRLIEKTDQMDDSDSWCCRWLAFASHLPSVGEPPFDSEDEGVWDDWITNAVEAFARQHQMLDHLKVALAPEATV